MKKNHMEWMKTNVGSDVIRLHEVRTPATTAYRAAVGARRQALGLDSSVGGCYFNGDEN